MQLKHLNQIIGRALSACRKASGEARGFLRFAIAFLNTARGALKRGDADLAHNCVHHALAFVRSAKAVSQ